MIMRRVLIVLACILCSTANAAPAQRDNAVGAADPDPSALIQFYPTPLTTSPVGALEDQQVWLAKVAGLISDAPPLLQQSILSSQTPKQFSANLALLQQLQRSTLADGIVAAKSVAKSGKLTAKRVDGKAGPNLGGSGPADTVFTSLEPCRIMDSRAATAASGVQGPLSGNQLYQLPGFIAAGQNWGSYGGNSTSDCGLNSDAGANIWAVAIVITVLNPNFDAFLGVGNNNTLAGTLSTVALNFTRGQGLSTQYIVPQGGTNTIYFAMPAQLSANIVFDVVGYFAVSQATALDCTTLTYSGTMGPLASGDTFVIIGLACDAGYSRTGVNCRSTVFNSGLALIDADTDVCTWYNGSASTFDTSNLAIRTTCCRVPGR